MSTISNISSLNDEWSIVSQTTIKNPDGTTSKEIKSEKQHTFVWQIGQALLFAIKIIFTLGVAYFFDCTHVTLQQALSGKEVRTEIINNTSYEFTSLENTIIENAKKTPEASLEIYKTFDPSAKELIQKIEISENLVKEIESNIGKKELKEIEKVFFEVVPKKEILKVFDQILQEFQKSKYQKKYGNDSFFSADLFKKKVGDNIPEYYANFSRETYYERKYLSLLGLRNLVAYGPKILEELREKLFIDGKHNYAQGKGLNKMVYYTGNVVDLYQKLNDCTSDANAKQQADIIISAFKEQFAEFKSQFTKRNIDTSLVDYVGIHKAAHNNDKGNVPIWKFHQGGICYAANVPDICDVLGALLLAPLQLAHSFLLIKALYKGKELSEKLDEFFSPASEAEENQGGIGALSTRCFNAKWNAIKSFSSTLRNYLKILEKHGQEAIDNAQDVGEILNAFEERLLPNPGAMVDPATWKKNKHTTFKANAIALGYWEKLFVEKDRNGKKTYAVLDDVLLNRMGTRTIEFEHLMGSNRFAK